MELLDGTIYGRDIADVIWANKLEAAMSEIDTGVDYTVDDYICTGLLTFPNAFLEASRGRVNIKNIVVEIYDTAGYKPQFQLLLFNEPECDIAPVKNTAFAWSTNTTMEQCVLIKDLSASYVTKGTYNRSVLALDEILSNETISSLKLGNNLTGILLLKATTGKFAANAWVKIGLQVIQM